jgi:hypothetical protein
MMMIMPNTGTFNDDYFDDLRSKAIVSLIEGAIPPAVLDYMQALEGRLLDQVYRDKLDFAKSSWAQFRVVERVATRCS